MKKLLILIVIAFGAYAFLKSRHAAEASAPPLEISNPVYSDTRVSMNLPDGGSVDMVVLMKNVDQADCEAQTRTLETALRGGGFASCTTCTTPRSQCMSALPPRFVAMFENRPSGVTYLSLPAGNQAERDTRIVYWGVTVEQSDSVCDAVAGFQKERKGMVTCVRARRG